MVAGGGRVWAAALPPNLQFALAAGARQPFAALLPVKCAQRIPAAHIAGAADAYGNDDCHQDEDGRSDPAQHRPSRLEQRLGGAATEKLPDPIQQPGT